MPISVSPDTSRTVNGQIYKRGRFWTVSYRVNGKRIVRSSGSTDRRVAEELLATGLSERTRQRELRQRRRALYDTRDAFQWLEQSSIVEILILSLNAFVEHSRKRNQPVAGIYFLRSESFVKIGYAKDFDIRKDDLQIGNPHELKLIAFLPGPLSLEGRLHTMFNRYRERGEWFRLQGDLAVFIEQISASFSVRGTWATGTTKGSDLLAGLSAQVASDRAASAIIDGPSGSAGDRQIDEKGHQADRA